jgi:DNA polymerase-1
MRLTKPKLIIIDGHSLLFRGFFATRMLTTSDGRPTNAVYSFTNMLLSLLESEQPDAVIVALDAPVKTFRHEEFVEYKAHRRETPEDFSPQVGMTKHLLQAFGIPVLEVPGYEADDIVGTLAKQGAEADYDVLIITGDMDALQLVNDHVSVRATVKGVADLHNFNPAAVEAKYGLRPDQIADFKALKGDPSDNIPGVPGIGEKTAVKLLQQFPHVEDLLERIDELADVKLREKILTNREIMLQSKRLATIVCEVPLDLEKIPSFELTQAHLDQLQRVLEDYEFRSILKKLPALTRKFGSKEVRTPVSQKENFTCQVVIRPDIRVIQECLTKAQVLGMRTLGEGGSSRASRPTMLALSTVPSTAYILPLESTLFMPEIVQAKLEEAQLPKCAYDAKRDLLRLRHLGIENVRVEFDALIAAYLLQSSRANYPLEWLAEEYLGTGLESENNERPGTEAALLLQLKPELEAQLKEESTWDLFQEIEMPVVPILAEMEWNGIRVDTAYLEELSARLEHDMSLFAQDIYKLAGEEFNIGSPKQLGMILFEKLGFPPVKKTKTGYSTDSEVLQIIAEREGGEIAFKIIQYRELAKIRSTYAEALPKLVNPETKRIHTTFNQTVAATGRLSSSEPNLQNIPIRTDLGREIRRAFVADPGHKLLSLDYSQIELRILAHMSNDAMLLEAFEHGRDIHSTTASILFNVEVKNVDSDMRRRAKTVNYAVLYGMSDFGLAQELSIGVAEAHQIIENYFQRFPHIKAYLESILEEARRKGYVSTLLGRRRYIPELNSSNRNERLAAERAAINTPFQGTAADIMKLAMINAWNRLRADRLKTRMLLQVHDELVLEAPEAEVQTAAYAVAEAMESAYTLRVPLTVERKAGFNWRDLELIPE